MQLKYSLEKRGSSLSIRNMSKDSDGFLYNPACIKEVPGCMHAVKIDGKLKAISGSELYSMLVKLRKPIPTHLAHYGINLTDLGPLPDEDLEL